MPPVRPFDHVASLGGGLSVVVAVRDTGCVPLATYGRLAQRIDDARSTAALCGGDVGVPRRRDMPTLGELIDEYLAQHVAEQNTIATLTARLKRARDSFEHVRLNPLALAELRAWRKTLPERSAWHYVKALR